MLKGKAPSKAITLLWDARCMDLKNVEQGLYERLRLKIQKNLKVSEMGSAKVLMRLEKHKERK